MSYRPRTAPRPTAAVQPAGRTAALRRPAQILVWVLFAIVAVVGLNAGGALLPTAPATVAAQPSAAAPGVLPAASEGGGGRGKGVSSSADLEAPTMQKYHIVREGTSDKETASAKADAAMELLPAYRWRDNVELVSDLGWRDIDDAGSSVLGGALFSMAAFLWTLLLTVTRYGLTTDMVTGAAGAINSGFASMAKSIGSSGLLAIAFVSILLTAIGAFFRGNLPKVLAMFFMFALPIGGMQALAVGANQGTDGFVPPLSPAGLAITGNQTINQIGGTLATGFGTTVKLSDVSEAANVSGGAASPDCTTYTSRLYATYAAASARNGKSGMSGSLWAANGGKISDADIQNQLSANGGLVTISYLWERAFLPAWTQAQFGNMTEGSLMACHRLELNNQTSPDEQMLLAGTSDSESPYNGFTRGPFLPAASEKDGQAAMFTWAACANANGKEARPGWKDIGGGKPDDKQHMDNAKCAGWRTAAEPTERSTPTYAWLFGVAGAKIADKMDLGNRPLDFKDTGDLARATTPATDASADVADSLQRVEQSVRAYWGHNSGQRMLWGLVACLTSALYLWALGAMSLGAIIAQVGLVVMLIVLPATLVLFALPGKGPAGRHPAGVRLLKLTGGFMASKLVLIFSLTLLIQLIALLESIVGGDGSGIWSALIPIAAMLALRALLKSIGFGDITKLGGALAMSGAGGALMSGDKKFAQSFQKGVDPAGQIQNRASKIGSRASTYNAMKRLSKDTMAGKAARTLGRGAAKGAGAGLGAVKRGGGHVGGFIADEVKAKHQAGLAEALKSGDPDALKKYTQMQKMADLKNSGMGFLAGYRDPETGERTSAGVMDRLGSLAGVTTALGDKGVISKGGLLYRFGTHNKANASRAEVLREQHSMAAALHAKRASAGVDPEARRQITSDFWNGQLEDLAVRSQSTENGRAAMAVGGASLSPLEVSLTKQTFAADAGCDADMVICSRLGLPPLVGTTHAPGRVIPKLSDDAATIENAKSLIHYLPKEWTAQQPGETQEEHHAKMTATLRAVGGMNADGVLSDTLAAFNIDVSTVDGKAEVLKAARGEASKLDNIVIDVPADVRKAIQDSIRHNRTIGSFVEFAPAVIEARAQHARALDAEIMETYSAAAASMTQVRADISLVSGSGDIADQAAKAIASRAEELAGNMVRAMGTATVEVNGLAALNANPGGEPQCLTQVQSALNDLDVSVSGHLASVSRLSAELIQAAGPSRTKIAAQIETALTQMIEEAGQSADKALSDMRDSERNIALTREQAKATQMKTAMRGKSFAGGTTALPAR